MEQKLISIVTPCYNEQDNIRDVVQAVRGVFAELSGYRYEHLFIDNASTDRTVADLRELAAQDKHIKVIVNTRNFGHIRSGTHGYLAAQGDAVIPLVADLQTPPQLIKAFLEQWEAGYKIVVGVRKQTQGSFLLSWLAKFYYKVIGRLSDTRLVENFMGFGLFDRQVIELIRQMDDPYPYVRGLIAEIGYPTAEIEYVQPPRKKGKTKNNFYSLYDLAMLGITNHSKVPLRLAAMMGFVFAIISLLVGLGYLVYKLIYWQWFSLGLAPVVIGLFFFASVQLFFLGIIGEYIGSIHTQVLRRPLVIEKERINFEAHGDEG